MNAIILAAGRGKRLRPLTDQIPKPLLPVVNQPILEHIICRLRSAGIRSIGINLSYKAPVILDFLCRFPSLVPIVELSLTDTGAPLRYFPDLTHDDFIVHNCDFILDLDLAEIIDFHLKHKALATWAVVKNPGTGRVALDHNRLIRINERSRAGLWTFTGLALYSRKIFEYFPVRHKPFSIKEPLRRAINDHQPVYGFRHRGYWRDLGTPRSYWQLHADLLRPPRKHLNLDLHRRSYLDPDSRVLTDKLCGFYCVAGNTYLGPHVAIRDAVVLPGARLEKGHYSACIIGRNFIWHYREPH